MSEEKINENTIAPTKKKSPFFWQNIGILCSAFSIIVLLAVGGYSTWYLMTANIRLAAVVVQSHDQLQLLQSDFNSLKETVMLAQQSAEDIKTLKQSVTELSADKQGNQEKWATDEARYYVKLANDRLQFSHDIPLAISLLTLADQEISHLADPKMADIRKMLATDIATLQAVPQIDVAGLYMKLMALNDQLDQLPLQVSSANPPSTTVDEQKKSAWQHGLHVIWQALQNIVIVRNHSNGTMPLITPDQKAFLYQNLHAMLSQSIWGLLHRQPEIYQTSLQQLTTWITRYCMLNAPNTHQMLASLAQLEKIDIHPPTVTLMNTLQAFNGV